MSLASHFNGTLMRKDTKSNPLTRKTAHKRLNINHFKERLVYFNGTVVIIYINIELFFDFTAIVF